MKALLLAASGVINQLVLIVAGLALIYFFWGLVKFIFNSASAEGQEEGKNIMKWGLVSLFVMVSIWGLVRFVGTALSIPLNGSGGSLTIPEGTPSPCGG